MKTNWTTATTSPTEAMLGLLSCLESGRNCWIEIQENGKQDYPIKEKNPALNDPFNWTMSYGVPRSKKYMAGRHYFNETERDLTENWSATFAEENASKIYIETGKATKGLLKSMGVCTPVRNKDLETLREDGYKYGYWVTIWKPKDNVPYWIPAKINFVFVICSNDEKPEKDRILKKCAEFLLSQCKGE